jgi:thioredoxin
MKRYINVIMVVSLMLGLSIITSCSKKEEPKTESKVDSKTQSVKNINYNNKTKMEHLTAETFKSKVFDYEKNKEWKFEGKNPAIIDFYADWCGPCKMVAPVLEDLSNEYDGKVDIYKVDTEVEQELAAVFGIRSIPSILFIPKTGQPQMSAGAMQKEGFVQAINEILLVQKN